MSKKKILAVVNQISEDPGVAKKAAWLARTLNAELHLVAIVHDVSFASELFHISGDLETSRQESMDRALAELEATCEALGLAGVGMDAIWDHPFDRGVMQAVADQSPDIVVMSLIKDTHPSRAEWRLIRECPVPLYIVRARDWGDSSYMLACVDPTHAHDKPAELDRLILALAGEVARAPGSTLHVLHAAGMTPELGGNDPYPDQYRRQLEEFRTNEIMQLVPLGWRETVEIHFTHTTPVAAVKAFVEARGADLVIIGSLSRSWVKELLIGGSVRELVPNLDRDILLVRPPAAA